MSIGFFPGLGSIIICACFNALGHNRGIGTPLVADARNRCTHRLLVDMCFISFIVPCSLLGSPVMDISTAANKCIWQFYRSELQRGK